MDQGRYQGRSPAVYAGSNVGKAREAFAEAIPTHKPGIRLTIRQRAHVAQAVAHCPP